MARPSPLRDVQLLTLQQGANDLTLAPEDAISFINYGESVKK